MEEPTAFLAITTSPWLGTTLEDLPLYTQAYRSRGYALRRLDDAVNLIEGAGGRVIAFDRGEQVLICEFTDVEKPVHVALGVSSLIQCGYPERRGVRAGLITSVDSPLIEPYLASEIGPRTARELSVVAGPGHLVVAEATARLLRERIGVDLVSRKRLGISDRLVGVYEVRTSAEPTRIELVRRAVDRLIGGDDLPSELGAIIAAAGSISFALDSAIGAYRGLAGAHGGAGARPPHGEVVQWSGSQPPPKPPPGGPPPSGSPRPGGPIPPKPPSKSPKEQPDYSLRATFPEQVQIDVAVELQVKVVLSRIASDGALMNVPEVPEDGLEITLIMYAKGFEYDKKKQTQPCRIWPDRDSDPVAFNLVAQEEGNQSIYVSAFYLSQYLGSTEVKVLVKDQHTTSKDRDWNSRCARPQMTDNIRRVTLVVRYDSDTKRYDLNYFGWERGDIAGQKITLKSGRETLVDDLVRDINEVVRNTAGYTQTEAAKLLRSAGLKMWKQLIPEPIAKAILRCRQKIEEILIVSPGDPMPWELLVPAGKGVKQHRFLVERIPVNRTLMGLSNDARSIKCQRPVFVVPEGSPSSAESEVEAIVAQLPKAAHDHHRIIRRFGDLLNLLEDPDFDLLHFSCHNDFVSSSIEVSQVKFGKKKFRTDLLEEHENKFDRRPFVFMNACRTGAQAAQYTAMGGWAQAFRRAGAGTFIGTLWEVRDTSAMHFADTVYQQLFAKQPLGAAITAGRKAVRDKDSGDPSWLAYSCYGDPLATMAV